MNGQPYFSNKSIRNSVNRRSFILQASFLSAGLLLSNCFRKLNGPKPEYAHIKGKLRGPNAKAGHILGDRTPLPEPETQTSVKTLIIGAGISGLSAARWLLKSGDTNFQLLELEDHSGGNSYFGSNAVSSYPLGAHYIPIINNEDKLLIDFLVENQVITHFDEQNLPFYNEYYLCFDPEERLLINGHWQEGLVPDFGVPTEERKQIVDFFKLMNGYRTAKGNDGKYAFDIPLDNSSSDPSFRKLDNISFTEYLQQNGFNSAYLLWYLNYCCKDDFGVLAANTSAWAGIHYFASRKGKAANTAENSVITWPEGNGWLMKQLRNVTINHIRTSQMVYSLTYNTTGGVDVKVFDLKTGKSSLIIAEKVIMASPQFVNQKILKDIPRPGVNYADLQYAPWLIANITVDKLPTAAKGMVLCWDNVAYGTASVGYVNANQQDLKVIEEKKVLTFYLPLCDKAPRLARLEAYMRTYDQWLDIVIPELEQMHPEITPYIEEIEFWLWGHGMVSPAVNYVWGNTRKMAQSPLNNKIFFAHTDLSGISIFEEAFHQGIKAAKQVLGT